ncbi:MAG: P-loop NTPase [Cyanobacteria bacterium P01_H01_bin.15]
MAISISMLRRHWASITAFNVAILGATAFLVLNYRRSFTPIWTADAQLNLPVKTTDLQADLGSLGAIRDSEQRVFTREINPLNLLATIITSSEVLEKAKRTDLESDSDWTIDQYRSLFTVIPKENSTLLAITASGEEPDLAKLRLESLIRAFQQRLSELRQNDISLRRQYAIEQLSSAKEQLNSAERKLDDFKETTGIVNSSEQVSGLLGTIDALRAERSRALSQSRASASQAQVLSEVLQMDQDTAVRSLRLAEDQEYQSLRVQLSALEATLAEARGSYTEVHPRVQRLVEQQRELRRQLDRRFNRLFPGGDFVDATLGGTENGDSRIGLIGQLIEASSQEAALNRQAQEIQQQIDNVGFELSQISQNETPLLQLEREYQIAEGLYKGLLAQLEHSISSPFGAYPNVQVLQAPTVNEKPSQPKDKVIILGGLLAAVFGNLALITGLQKGQTLLRPEDLQRAELPVLVTIARLEEAFSSIPPRVEAELEFERLAAAIQSLTIETGRLLITSASFGEGKTTVTLNLGWALAALGFHVLLIDGDLRRRELTRRLALQVSTGAERTVLTENLSALPALSMASDKIGEFYAQGGFRQFIERNIYGEAYDYILIDTPPVSLTVDPLLMSSVVPNVLFVIRPGESDRFAVIDSLRQLEQQQARIVGVVANDVESQQKGQYSYSSRSSLTSDLVAT